MKRGILLLFLLFTFSQAFYSFISQPPVNSINWISFEEMLKLNEKEPRKVIVNITTEWCVGCRKMEATTYRDYKLVKYINDKFYAVQFDAEFKGDLRFNGEDFKFNPHLGKRGVHNLALYLSNGKSVYPTTSILDETLESPQPISGFLEADDLEFILNYFGENHYKSIEWSVYNELYSN